MRFVVDASDRARVLVSGPDGAAFLHRLSTQHVSDLSPGAGLLNAFTTDKGRLKDLVHHLVLDEGVLLLGHRLTTAALIEWLDRYLFSEKVELSAFGAGCVVADAATVDAVVAGSAALAPWQHRRDGAVVVVRTFDRVDRSGVVVPAFVAVDLAAAATLSADDDRAMSVAAGIPGEEIGEAHTPLDLDLHDAISWNKGCYIGQEVIARLDTYGKQRKHLVSLRTTRAVAPGSPLTGAVTGVVTSVAAPWGTEAGGQDLPNALALIKGSVDGATDVDCGTLLPRRAAQTPHD